MSKTAQRFSVETIEQMLYLCRCTLRGEAAALPAVKKMDLSAVYQAAAFHSLTVLAGQALEAIRDSDPFWQEEGVQSVMESFHRAYTVSVRQQVMLALEYQELSAWMEQQKIWHMPLKGIVLKEDYPKLGLRQMCDYDVLFDDAYAEQLRGWFAARDYEEEAYGHGVHDVYRKAPVYHFEMHRALYGEGHEEAFVEYYRNVRERLTPDEGKQYACHFSREDFYIYILTHAYKHYSIGGTGLRLLSDLYVFQQKHREELDLACIDRELAVLHLTEFERTARELAFALYGGREAAPVKNLAPELQKMFSMLSGSGTYGTMENRVKNQVEKYGKLSYLMRRVFPTKSTLSYYLPACRKYTVLYPAGWLVRAFVVVFQRRRTTFKELNLISAYRSDSEE